MKKKEETGFAPSDRPRNWRDECKRLIKQIAEVKLVIRFFSFLLK